MTNQSSPDHCLRRICPVFESCRWSKSGDWKRRSYTQAEHHHY
jgi:hypothetical protein